MKVIVIGAVRSTKRTLEKLIEHDLNVCAVFGQSNSSNNTISGWCDLEQISNQNSIKFFPFDRINDQGTVKTIQNIEPDIIFAVGFSQLVSKEILSIPKLGCIGFHPTQLPRGRGRAPIAWLILSENIGASTFFLMGEGADDGPIFAQEKFKVDSSDDASTIESKILYSIDVALDNWLPELKKGIWDPQHQDEQKATYYGKRNPIDGLINWNDSHLSINKLIKATTKPYPGAFSFYKDQKLLIWKCQIEENMRIKGVIGRVLIKNAANHLLIQAGDGLLWLTDYEIIDYNNESSIPDIKVGERIGYNVEYEIYKIKKLISNE